jgi:hypothetical protein
MFKLARFVFGVRAQLRGYRQYIALIDVGLEAAEDKIVALEARITALETINCTLDSQVRHYRGEYHKGLTEIKKLEDYADELEDTYGDDDDSDDDEHVPAAYLDLLNTLEEAGLDPARRYSVGELLDIKNALQAVRIA